ncbi:MAG TPA: hypothetical protein VKA55_03540 [Gammaproteobacteria bacterium]|nr:hypothetical protein [Gammaproteobacteria bacterium]
MLAVLPAASPADHPAQGVETLAGLPGVTVDVAPLTGPLAGNGEAREAVRRAVAGALTDAGVATGPGRHAARLRVHLDARYATRRFLALAIELDLRQHVRLDRSPEQVISAITWSNAAVTPLREGAYGQVPGRVADLVRQTFIPDFLAANPPRK